MGTRADFYVGRGKDAEWLGSIAWDGYPEGLAQRDGKIGDPITAPVLTATDEVGFRAAVAALLAGRRDGTTPDMGWPWPWEDSRLTDYSYAFDDGKVHASNYGYPWHDPLIERDEAAYEAERGCAKVDFPDMTDRKAVTLGPRSGLIVIR